jgi:hypothetical protein
MDMARAFLYTPRSARACKRGGKDRELIDERLEDLKTLSSVTDLRQLGVNGLAPFVADDQAKLEFRR